MIKHITIIASHCAPLALVCVGGYVTGIDMFLGGLIGLAVYNVFSKSYNQIVSLKARNDNMNAINTIIIDIGSLVKSDMNYQRSLH